MKFLYKLNPEWTLRLGLGLMYVYSGLDIFRHPTAWYWALRPLPSSLQVFINNEIGINNFLKIQAVGELVLAALFLAWFLPRRLLRLAAFLAILEMALILWLVGVDAVTFRDIGLLGAALALLSLSYR